MTVLGAEKDDTMWEKNTNNKYKPSIRKMGVKWYGFLNR